VTSLALERFRLIILIVITNSYASAGSGIDAQGRHAMVCKKAPGKIARHQVLNDVIGLADLTTCYKLVNDQIDVNCSQFFTVSTLTHTRGNSRKLMKNHSFTTRDAHVFLTV